MHFSLFTLADRRRILSVFCFTVTSIGFILHWTSNLWLKISVSFSLSLLHASRYIAYLLYSLNVSGLLTFRHGSKNKKKNTILQVHRRPRCIVSSIQVSKRATKRLLLSNKNNDKNCFYEIQEEKKNKQFIKINCRCVS